MNLNTLLFSFVISLVILHASIVFADCTNPAGVAGEIKYGNSRGGYSFNRVEYCDGTNWHDTSWSPTNNACTQAGQITYVGATSTLQYCNGSYFVSMKGPTLGACTVAGQISYNTTTNVLQYCGNDSSWRTVSACRRYLSTAGFGSWTVPTDWSSSYNRIEVIGGGGAGGGGQGCGGGTGGGGGGYSLATNVALTGGGTVSYRVGGGGTGVVSGNGGAGGNSYFCTSTSNCASINGTAVVAGSYGGGGGTEGAGAVGSAGLTLPISGNVTFNGGAGGAGVTGCTGSPDGGGGGGAAGPFAAGNSGTSGGGTNNGGSGDGGRGGSGGTGAASPIAGGVGVEWFNVGSVTYGAGGGGGGSSGNANDGADGGRFGAGGGGSSRNTGRAGGDGARGIIVITYSNGSSTTGCE